MPQELPGFYFDVEKNRYFPIKGPIPGTSRSTSVSSSTVAHSRNSKPTQRTNSSRTEARTSKLLQVRELNGNVLSLTKGKCNFKEEFQKRLVSQPVVWKYQGTNKTADVALEQIQINVQTSEGQIATDVLLTGSINGSFSLFEVGKVGQHSDNAVKFIPDRVWPLIKENKIESCQGPDHIWKLKGASVLMPSSVSSIKLSEKHSCASDGGSNIQHALITSLGSETSGGSVSVLNLVDPFDLGPHFSIIRQNSMREVASFNCTIWTADCCTNSSQAVIGTNLGAAVVDLETGMSSWVCRSKSDVLAQQLNQSGNIVLCGFRNGAIVTVDVRERQRESSTRSGRRHRIPYSRLQRTDRLSDKQRFELRGNICPSQTIFMPSSISCLLNLRLYDQYFLASSMDGTVKLYDHRLTKRGAIQSYEGHVNSHTRLQLGVDQSERFVMSGGEDCNLRLWSIKSGELLFEDKFSNSVPSAVCWQRTRRFMGTSQKDLELEQRHGSEAWIGTQDGLYLMNWF
ncbi:DDB1- and CUL4-associated factor 4-like [Melia azedarach]|uniref:DDB1- and CUL4-associated factor 4-like n=1 Tax=Melia azedarach TaxID=155640 RepID=A0ACC1WWP5_MELAZ|nr:DDB1- and CUL4-associated factor 4-like [Melia azedarach]